jgi:hypothetical protein
MEFCRQCYETVIQNVFDFRDTRGGAYDHVNEFGNPQRPQVTTG